MAVNDGPYCNPEAAAESPLPHTPRHVHGWSRGSSPASPRGQTSRLASSEGSVEGQLLFAFDLRGVDLVSEAGVVSHSKQTVGGLRTFVEACLISISTYGVWMGDCTDENAMPAGDTPWWQMVMTS